MSAASPVSNIVNAVNNASQNTVSQVLGKSITDTTIDEVTWGMMFAALSITDDKPDTLKNVCKVNPWHGQALSMITGSKERAHMPLTDILKEHMSLELDAHIDCSGLSRGGHTLDSQGYIAHNDKIIVLAYRCTTSAFDWLTNFNTTTSEWEIEEDLAQGFSGYCSGLEGLCCTRKPRVHTGFYNNFLVTLPLAKQYIEPLLEPDQPPRKLFVCGHSLGAGVASLATCYFLLDRDWRNSPHSLVGVTAGAPRACGINMADLISERLAEQAGSARLHRLVKGSDIVSSVPPKALGFRHIGTPTRLMQDGTVQLASGISFAEDDEAEATTDVAKELAVEEDTNGYPEPQAAPSADSEEKQKYDKMVNRIPQRLRDHMPDFYLQPLFQAHGVTCGSVQGLPKPTSKPVADRVVVEPPSSPKVHNRERKGFRGLFTRRKKTAGQ